MFIVLLIAGCGASGEYQTRLKHFYAEVSKEASGLQKSPCITLRYNPTPCRCTDFEVKTSKGWYRALLEGDERVIEGIKLKLKRRKAAVVKVRAVVDGVERCDCGIYCIELRLGGKDEAGRVCP